MAQSKNRNKKTTKKVANSTKSKTIKEEIKSNKIYDTIKNIFNELKDVKKKFNNFSKTTRWSIIICVVCAFVLIAEGILVIIHEDNRYSNVVFHDSYNAVAVDNYDLVLAGTSDFKYSKYNEYTNNTRGKLIKYDSTGEVVFEKEYERGISTTFNSVISVSDGYIVVGTGIFSEQEKEEEAREAIIIKYSKDGELVWEKFYQVITNTGFNKVIEVSDGYIAIGQSIYANMELGNSTAGGGVIVKYDKNGNEVWHNNHGGTKSGNFNDIVEVNSDLYVVGKDGADSANIVKFSASGEYQWHKNYSFTDEFGFSGVSYLNGNLYVVGSKKILPAGIGENDDRTTTNTDALLLKYDLEGNVVFEKTFGGSSYERYNSILMYRNNFYVVGHICSHDAGLKVTTDKDDEMTGLIIRYDINGNILKKETFGGSNNDNLTDITTDDISLYVVGYSNSKDGNIETSSNNGKDYFGKLIKLDFKFKKIFAE